MRVGLFTESFDPVVNGVSTSVKTLAVELLRAGHTPIVVAPRFPGFADSADSGFEVRRLPSWRSLFNPQNPFAYPPLGPPPRVLRDLRLDIVHTQQPFGMGLHGQAMARRLSVPLISTFHTLYTEYTHYFWVVPHGWAFWWVVGVMRRHYEACAGIVVPSREAGRRLEHLGIGLGRIHVIPTGVPEAPSVLSAAIVGARNTYDLPPGAPVLLFVGRIAREKNLDLLIDAFADLCAQPETREKSAEVHPILLLVGSGPYRDALRARVRAAGIDRWVRFAGFLSRDQLGPVYAATTLFCFPSPTETQGVVLSEAQSHGLPCVAVEGGGAPEFIRPGVDALLVPNRLDTFVGAIRALLNDPARRQAFAAAARNSPLRPTPAQMARQIIGLYEETLRAHASPSPAAAHHMGSHGTGS